MNRNLGRVAVFAAMAAASVAGCTGGSRVAESASLGGVVLDSAGVRVVEHAGIPEDLPVWTISEDPSLSIGALDGPEAEVFMGVSELVVRSDGSIVAVDRGPGELRAFDAAGRHLWTAGQRGDGPGEFGANFGNFNIYVALLPADSVLTWDLSNRRFQVFDPDGVFRRIFALEPAASANQTSRPSFEGTLDGGVIVTRNTLAGSEVVANAGYMSQIFFFGLHDGDGRAFAEVGRVPEIPRSYERFDGGTSNLRLQLGSDARHAVGGGLLAAGSQSRIDIHQFRADGSLAQIVRVNTPPTPVDQGMRDADLQEAIDGAADLPVETRRRIEELFRGAEYAATLPAFRSLMLDAEGRLWVEEYVLNWEDRVPVWTIFGSDGAMLARTTIPDDFTPLHIAEDHVVGVWLDDLEVPYVQVRPILRTEGP